LVVISSTVWLSVAETYINATPCILFWGIHHRYLNATS
jgi:hypothetical protein